MWSVSGLWLCHRDVHALTVSLVFLVTTCINSQVKLFNNEWYLILFREMTHYLVNNIEDSTGGGRVEIKQALTVSIWWHFIFITITVCSV